MARDSKIYRLAGGYTRDKWWGGLVCFSAIQ